MAAVGINARTATKQSGELARTRGSANGSHAAAKPLGQANASRLVQEVEAALGVIRAAAGGRASDSKTHFDLIAASVSRGQLAARIQALHDQLKCRPLDERLPQHLLTQVKAMAGRIKELNEQAMRLSQAVNAAVVTQKRAELGAGHTWHVDNSGFYDQVRKLDVTPEHYLYTLMEKDGRKRPHAMLIADRFTSALPTDTSSAAVVARRQAYDKTRTWGIDDLHLADSLAQTVVRAERLRAQRLVMSTLQRATVDARIEAMLAEQPDSSPQALLRKSMSP